MTVMRWPGQRVRIHYARTNKGPDPKWREREGYVIAVSRGPGPRNVAVKTELGMVVVPVGNTRPLYDEERVP